MVQSPPCSCSWIAISSDLCHALYFWCYPSFIYLNISWGWTAGLCLSRALHKAFASCLTRISMNAWCMCSFYPHNAAYATVLTEHLEKHVNSAAGNCAGAFSYDSWKNTLDDNFWKRCFIFMTYYANVTSDHFPWCLLSLWMMLLPNRYDIHFNHLCELFNSICEIVHA